MGTKVKGKDESVWRKKMKYESKNEQVFFFGAIGFVHVCFKCVG